jgi:hypothetical protein
MPFPRPIGVPFGQTVTDPYTMWEVSLRFVKDFQKTTGELKAALIARNEAEATKALLELQQDVNYLVDSLKGE